MNNKYLTIFWHQNKEYVSLETFIEIEYIKDIKITNELFKINNEKYTMTFKFFNEINQENIEFNSIDNKLKIKLEKKNYEYWNYLAKNNEFKNQIKVNWNFWKDEDEDEEEDNQQEAENMPFNMEEMMASMQNNT